MRSLLVQLHQRIHELWAPFFHRHACRSPLALELVGATEPLVEILRQHRIKPFAKEAGQRRRPAVRGNRNRNAVAPEHAAKVRARVRGVVDRVHEEAAALGFLGDGAVHLRRRGSHDQPLPGEIGRLEAALDDPDSCQSDRLAHVGRHDGDVGAGGSKRVNLAGGDDTTADDEHRALGEFQKDRKQLERSHNRVQKHKRPRTVAGSAG